jgi:hypothetical protein
MTKKVYGQYSTVQKAFLLLGYILVAAARSVLRPPAIHAKILIQRLPA